MSEQIDVTLNCNICQKDLSADEANWAYIQVFNLNGVYCKPCILEVIQKPLTGFNDE
jgi:hypothetical protein